MAQGIASGLTVCTYPGCDNGGPFCREWCVMHYTRWLRHGDPGFSHFDPDRGCLVDGCESPHYAKSLCNMHWSRLRASGELRPTRHRGRMPECLTERMEPQPNGCIHFTGPISRSGYGVLRADGKWSAHRVSYEYFIGPIPEGFHVDHTCHNIDLSCPGGPTCLHRRCVNPEHLEAVTSAVNSIRATSAKATCRMGHPYPPDGLPLASDGTRCPTCLDARIARRDAARRSRRVTA